MDNLVVMFLIVMGSIALFAFILPDANKSRTKSAKNALKTEFPGFLYLFIAAAIISILFGLF
jgi:hypothetical protein